ncbi:MAG: thioredoxin [Paludibacteraceae bacterium]|jgi:thioredoxin 1|nr:thioredoxin [Paludibacteraceae bacterium]
MALQFTDATFDEILSSNEVVVADFWAEWCGPCKMVGPFIEQLSEEYAGKAAVGKIDIEENDDLATKYAIRNIPTVLFFKNGEVVDKMVGAAPKSAYEEKLKSLL